MSRDVAPKDFPLESMTQKVSTPFKKRRKTNYINNRDLCEALTQYSQKYDPDNRPEVSNYIVQCIQLLTNNYGKRFQFNRYSYLDEMKADALVDCLKYMHNFNPNKTNNAFAYLTQFIHNAFIRRIKKEQLQQYVKIKNVYNHFSLEEIEAEGMDRHVYDNNLEFMERFEKSLKKKKAPAKKQGLEDVMITDNDE